MIAAVQDVPKKSSQSTTQDQNQKTNGTHSSTGVSTHKTNGLIQPATQAPSHRTNGSAHAATEDRTNLIINYLPYTMTSAELNVLFSSIGDVKSCKVISVDGEPRGYGFVDFHDPKDAAKAVRELNGLHLLKKTIRVSFALPPGEYKKSDAAERKRGDKAECKGSDGNEGERSNGPGNNQVQLKRPDGEVGERSVGRSEVECNVSASKKSERSNGFGRGRIDYDRSLSGIFTRSCQLENKYRTSESGDDMNGTVSIPYESQQDEEDSCLNYECPQEDNALDQPEGIWFDEEYHSNTQQLVPYSTDHSDFKAATPFVDASLMTYYPSAVPVPYVFHESFASYPGAGSSYSPAKYSPSEYDGTQCIHGNVQHDSSATAQAYAASSNVYMASTILYSWPPSPRAQYSIYVSNLHPDAEDIDLWQLFGPFGAVKSAHVVKDKRRNQCKGFGFVNMVKYEEAAVAVQTLNKCSLDGKVLQVAFNRYDTY